MKTPTGAMLWQIWRAWRLGFVLDAAYLIFAAATARMLPDLLAWASADLSALPMAGRSLAMPCAFFLVHLVAAFSLAGADDLNQNGFARKMYVLPVQTWKLAVLPMIGGSLSVGALWVFVAGLVLRPTGHATPLWWPAAAFCVAVATIQTTSWIPLRQNWLRIFLLLPALAAAAGLAAAVVAFNIPEPIAAGAFLLLLAAWFPLGIRCVAADRRGDAYDWGAWFVGLWTRVAGAVEGPRRPFSSPLHAQTWFELRRTGWMLPAFTIAMTPLPLLMIFAGGEDVQIAVKMGLVVLLSPVFIGSMIGADQGAVAFPFLAVRPVADSTIIRCKSLAALISAAVAHVPVFLFLPLLLLRPGVAQVLRDAVHAAGPLRTAAVVVAVPILLVLLTWKGMIENQWIALVGRAWVKLVFGVATAMGVSFAFAAGIWFWIRPDLREWLLPYAPWLVGGTLLMKAVLAAFAASGCMRARLLRSADVVRAAVVWAAVVATLVAVGLWSTSSLPIPARGIVAAAVLLIPFGRIVGAPLALAWNRHR